MKREDTVPEAGLDTSRPYIHSVNQKRAKRHMVSVRAFNRAYHSVIYMRGYFWSSSTIRVDSRPVSIGDLRIKHRLAY